MIDRAGALDPLTDLWVLTIGMPDDGNLMRYNDLSASYDEVRDLIIEARAVAQAELEGWPQRDAYAGTCAGPEGFRSPALPAATPAFAGAGR